MKKLFCILISSVLLVCAVFALAGCGQKSQNDNKADRALDTSLVGVWQGSDGTVYVELKDFEHDDYQFISDSGQGATSIEFSLDGGSSWARQDPVEYFFNQTDRGIYSILSYDGNGFTCYLTGHEGENMPQQNPKFSAGADLSITFRIIKRASGRRRQLIRLKLPAQITAKFLQTITERSYKIKCSMTRF